MRAAWALLAAVVLAAAAAVAQSPPCAATALQGDCTWTPAAGGAAVLTGVLAPRDVGGITVSMPPAVFAGPAAGSAAPGEAAGRLQLSNAILVGFDLPDPAAAGPETLLRPTGLLPAASAASGRGPLLLRDVRLLVSPETLRRHLLFFSPREHNRSAAANTTFVYTDGASFLHVNSWFNQHTTWRSVGLLVAATLEEALSTAVPPPPANGSEPSGGRPARNYVIAADAGTAVPQMLGRFALATPAPLILYITSNVTLSKPPVPAAGVDVMRSVALVGLASQRTSLDFAMQANQLIMAPGPRHRWGYVICDSIILENLGQGDRRSAEIAKPLTVTYTLNFWPLYYDRNTLRNSNNNVTVVVHDKSDLDYMLYWLTVYRSNLPLHRKMAGFLRDSLGFTKWELAGKVEPETLSGVSLYTSSVRVDYNIYTSIPQVAKPLPLPPVDPFIADALASKPNPRDLPVVVAISTASGLQAALSGDLGQAEAGRDYVVVLRGNMSLAPNASAGWPPPGGQPVVSPVQLLGEGTRLESDNVMVSLDFGFTRGILSIPSTSSEGVLTIKRVSLVGLPQGPGAAEAAMAAQDGGTPQAPELWTLLMWSIASANPAAVVLDNCEVALPPNEFEALRMYAAASRDFAIPLHASGGGGGGRRLLRAWAGEEGDDGAAERAAFITASGAKLLLGTAPRIQIASLVAGPVKGINVTLEVDRRAGVPNAWPAQSGAAGATLSAAIRPQRGGPGSRRALPAWGVALAVTGAAAVAAGVAGAAAFALRQRRRRHAAWNGNGKAGAQFDSSTSGVFGGSSPGKSAQKQQSARSAPLLLSGGNLSDPGSAAVDVSGIQVATDRPLLLDVQPTTRSSSPSSTPAAARAGPAGRPPAPGAGDSQASNGGGPDRRQRVQAAIASMQQAILARRLHPAARARGASGPSPGPQAAAAAAIGSAQAPATPGLPDAEGPSHGTSSGTPSGSQAGAVAPAAGPEPPQGGGSSVWGLAAYQVLPQGFEELLPAAGAAGAGGGPPEGAATRPLPSASTGDGSAASRGAAGSAGPRSDGGGQGGLSRGSGVQLLDVMGRGSFSTVYKGVWMGRFVAVKVLPLQALSSSDGGAAAPAGGGGGGLGPDPGTYERMAVMEAVISSTLSHPNIVQVYTYHITPAAPLLQRGSAPRSGVTLFKGPAAGYELQLVMEFCEEGSLRDALDCGLLVDAPLPASDLDPAASDAASDSDLAIRRPLTGLHYVLSLAHDVAVAMLHLHSEAMVHGDLKASNVLLARCSGAAAAVPATALSHDAAAYAHHRFVAKVSDFGLSLHLGPEATHVSRTHAGTLSHMAPELMLEGRASRASDVYSYGILLWELLTGGRAFDGIPAPLLCIKVVQEHWRPRWPQGVCAPLRALAEACWSPTPGARPNFDAIVSYLEGLLQNPAGLERDASPTAGG